VAKVTVPTVAERNDSDRNNGSKEKDFGHPDRSRASNNRNELD
jgi:hypothetical protein